MAEIESPTHYTDGAPVLEPMELTLLLPHPLASAFEYVFRAGKKAGARKIDDLKKAQFWLDAAIERIEANAFSYPVLKKDALHLLFVFAEKDDLARRLDGALRTTKNYDERAYWLKVLRTARKFVAEKIDAETWRESRKDRKDPPGAHDGWFDYPLITPSASRLYRVKTYTREHPIAFYKNGLWFALDTAECGPIMGVVRFKPIAGNIKTTSQKEANE